MQNHSAGTAYSGPGRVEVRFHSQGGWILTRTLLKPEFWRMYVQYSLNVLAFLLILDVEIRLTDRYRRIASLQPVPLAARVKECVQTQCVFNIFNAARSESLGGHRGRQLMHGVEALARQRVRSRPGTSPALVEPPSSVSVVLF